MTDKFDSQAIADKYRFKFGEANFVHQIEKVYNRVLTGGIK